MTGLSPERLGPLRVAKLSALLGSRLSDPAPLSSPMGTGAAILQSDGRGAVLVEDATNRSLGGAITWAVRRGATELVVIVDADEATAAHLAREGTWFSFPVTVERIVGHGSVPVPPAHFVVTPEIVDDPMETSGLTAMMTDAGIEVVTEHGVIRGEVHGLEVARIVMTDGIERLEVGVGRFDREISTMMFASIPTADALAKAIELVRKHRRPASTVHPLRDLVPERWIRQILLDDPSPVGAAVLRAADSTVEPENLRVTQPTAALGLDDDGDPIVVVCTAGIDLDVVPLAADTREMLAPDAQLVICGPARSLVPATRAVGAALIRPTRFVEVELPY